jgi:ligand-binding SRPBCC domain-containing protein
VTFDRTTIIHAPLDAVFAFFAGPENLGRITPPSVRFRIISGPDRPLRQGDRITYRMRILGIPLKWRTLISEWRDGERFADLQENGPYKYWLHTHTFRETAPGVVEMHDHVDYELPLGILGRLVAGRFVRRQLESIFAHRAKVIGEVFAAGSEG